MKTFIQQEQITTISASNATTTFNDKVSAFWEALEFNRFGLTPLLVVVVACMGGIAGAFAIQASPVKLGIVVLSTGLAEASLLAVLPMKLIAIASTLAVIVSLLTIVL